MKWAYLSPIILIAACARPQLGDLPGEYTNTMRQIGHLAVYPPREDFHVGDVFFRVVKRGQHDHPLGGKSYKVGTLDSLRAKALEETEARFRFTDTAKDDINPTTENPDTYQDDLPFPEAKATRLPAVAFPEIVATIATQGGVGGVLGRTFFGAGGSNKEVVRMRFDAVRRLEAPIMRPSVFREAYAEFEKKICPQLPDLSVLPEIMQQSSCGQDNECDFSIVTDVYYTRKITYTYTHGDVFGADISAASVMPASGDPPIRTNIALTIDISDVASTPLLEAVSKMMKDAPIPAKGFNFGTAAGRGFAFDETFPAPVAIAADGFTLAMETCSANPPAEAGASDPLVEEE